MNIIQDLTQLRAAVGKTQQELAIDAGLSRMTVQRIEAQEIDPRLSTVVEMARAMGMALILVPQELRRDVEAFLRSGGRVLGQPAGAGAPPSVVEALNARATGTVAKARPASETGRVSLRAATAADAVAAAADPGGQAVDAASGTQP